MLGRDTEVILGAAATVIGLIGYLPYYRDIFRGITRPHPFSWFLWSLLAAIAFAAQLVEGAGPGAWASGISAAANLGICIASLFRGTRTIRTSDWACLIAASIALFSWAAAGNPTLAILLVTATNSFAFGPTFRKSFERPQEETANTYLLSAVKWALACAALQSITLATALFPFTSFVLNAALACVLLGSKRRQRRAVLP